MSRNMMLGEGVRPNEANGCAQTREISHAAASHGLGARCVDAIKDGRRCLIRVQTRREPQNYVNRGKGHAARDKTAQRGRSASAEAAETNHTAPAFREEPAAYACTYAVAHVSRILHTADSALERVGLASETGSHTQQQLTGKQVARHVRESVQAVVVEEARHFVVLEREHLSETDCHGQHDEASWKRTENMRCRLGWCLGQNKSTLA